MKNVHLIEDHDEALTVWRESGWNNLDLIHVDAHMDYRVHPARPPLALLREVSSVRELKEKLEYTLAFQKYQKDLSRQTDIGNYIYDAMIEGIVRNFTWVVPGSLADFRRSIRAIKGCLRDAARAQNPKARLAFSSSRGVVAARINSRWFRVCALEALPRAAAPVLLDIDTDFLVIPHILKASHIDQIGQRAPWISPAKLVETLAVKLPEVVCVTVAYSTRGGWTPARFRHLADETASAFAPELFRARAARHRDAARVFDLFLETGSARAYRKALRLDPGLRGWDNNYGPLYLERGRFRGAEAEFRKILRVDEFHPGALWGMGVCQEKKKNFMRAKYFFERAWRSAEKDGIPAPFRKQIMFSLALSSFLLKSRGAAREMFLLCRDMDPLDSRPVFYLGRLAAEERMFDDAADYFQQAIQLGHGDAGPIFGLLKIVRCCGKKSDIIKYVRKKIGIFRKNFLVLRGGSRKKPVPRLKNMEKTLLRLLAKCPQEGSRG